MQRFIFLSFFAYYDSLLPISLDEIINRLQKWLNNPQCGRKEGEKFPFFGEITIKASFPIYVRLTSPASYKSSKQNVFENNIDMFMPHVN